MFTASDMHAMYGPGVVSVSWHRRRVWCEIRDPRAAMRVALQMATRPWVDAVTVLPPNASVSEGGLALAFGEHLHQVRKRRNLHGAWVTSPCRPPLPRSRLCRLPHLVTVEGPDGEWCDTVVWEVMTADQFTEWLGRPPDELVRRLEEWLPGLLRLRAAAREGHLPDSRPHHMLRGLLAARYLSIRLVLEHPHLFSTLLKNKEM